MSQPKIMDKAALRKAQQRERIQAAARCCFESKGFHAASMAVIAEKAQMSPGLIYRYFENKNAIILAIIEKQLEIARARIQQLHSSRELSDRILEYFLEREENDENSMSAILHLEISAEASRDPQIAEALEKYDVEVCSELASWLSRSTDAGGCGLPTELAQARAFLLVALIEGLKARGMRQTVCDMDLFKRTLDGIIVPLVT